MGHGSALARLERQTRLGTVKRLDLALLVDRQNHRVGGGMHIEADDVLDLLGEGGILGALEGAPAVGLQLVGPPDALDGSERQVHGLSHGPAGPMGGLARRVGARQSQHFGDRCHSDRCFAGFAASLAQEPLDALLSIVMLPAPHCRAADTSFAGDLHG